MKLREVFFGIFVGVAMMSFISWLAAPKSSGDKPPSTIEKEYDTKQKTKLTTNVEYMAYTQAVERRYKLRPNLLVAICTKESNWQNVESTKGAIGVCQIKPTSLEQALGPHVHPMRPMLFKGSSGVLVRLVQDKVGAVIDGVFGSDTALLVGKYQADHILRVDGIVGPQTWNALLGPTNYTQRLWNQHDNIEFAAKYISWLREQLETDDPSILMAAYYAGPGHQVVKYMVSVDKYRQSLLPTTEVY